MKKTIKQFSLAGVGLLSAMVLSGCWFGDQAAEKIGKKIVEETIESQTGGQVDIDSNNGEVSIKSSEGEFSMSGTGEAKLQKNFPTDVYIAPDAKITVSMVNGQDNSYSAAYTTEMKTDEVYAKYKEELKKSGWSDDPQTEISFGDSKTIVYKKGKKNLTVIVGKSEDSEAAGKTYVQVIGADDASDGASN